MIELYNNRMARREEGFTTAELLGNAALGVAALAAIYLLFGTVGDRMIQYIQDEMFVNQRR